MTDASTLRPQDRQLLAELMALHSAVETLFGALHRSQPGLAQEVLEELQLVAQGIRPDFQQAHQELVARWKASIAPD